MTTFTDQFKVVSVSSTTNSFGLRGAIIMSKSGVAYEIATSYLYPLKKGQVLDCLLSDTNNLKSIQGISYELPQRLPDAPKTVAKEVWKP